MMKISVWFTNCFNFTLYIFNVTCCPTSLIHSPQHRALNMAIAQTYYIILFYFLKIVKIYI
jgi:hypothetical protein